MRLVKQNQLSVGELVKCVECGTVDGSTNDMRKLAGNYVTDGSFAWQFAFVNTLADKRLRDESLSFEGKRRLLHRSAQRTGSISMQADRLSAGGVLLLK